MFKTYPIATGLPLIWFQARDHTRTLQTASGAYLLAFIVAHTNAVLQGRHAGIETDWIFAGRGADGPPPFLIPYYPLAVLAVVIHCAFGLRVVMRGHGVDPRRTVVVLSLLGTLAVALIIAALMGLRIRG